MVGSSMNCAAPMTVMNTIVGRQLMEFKEDLNKLMAAGMEQDSAILNIIKRYIIESKSILFEGDGYSEAWSGGSSSPRPEQYAQYT